MKRLGITQRVENIASYDERRDCLDQRWSTLALALGYIPVPLPNVTPTQAPSLLTHLDLTAVLFSGGNSLASFDAFAMDSAPERDAFESSLLHEARAREIPVIGVCRGMQLINVELGGRVKPVLGHVGARHSIFFESGLPIPDQVNSYHRWAIPGDALAIGLTPLALDDAGNVEAFESTKGKLLGMMWHPEREQPFNPLDITLIRRYLP